MTVLIDAGFPNTSTCNQAVLHLIPNLSITQIDNQKDAPVRVRIVQLGRHVFMRWNVTATTLFTGPRLNGGYPLGIISGDRSLTEQAWTRGQHLKLNSLAGVQFDRPEMMFSIPAGGQLDVAVIRESVASKIMLEFGGPGLRQKLENFNVCLLSADYWGRFERAVDYRLTDPGIGVNDTLADRFIVMLAQMLTDSVESDYLKGVRKNRWEVCRDVVEFAHELPPGQPPRVVDLMKAKTREDDTIARAVKEQFGMKPLELMRIICLEKARMLLMYPELRRKEGLNGVGAVHRRFGWVKGDKFAAQYMKHFGVKPSEDLVKPTR